MSLILESDSDVKLTINVDDVFVKFPKSSAFYAFITKTEFYIVPTQKLRIERDRGERERERE